ncbi:MAG: acyl-CoA dehydrogenase family protein [Myxococcota bacterium]|nr:acyl-CoA dehydrogenase family protein [Myxococcota bacterium]
MNFDFSDEQKLLQQTVRDYLADNCPLSVCREILETDKPYADDLWKGAAEMGWQGAVIPEEYGGAGFGHLELAVIAEEVGRALAPIPFSASVYFATEAILGFGTDEQKKKYLTGLADGSLIGTFALTEQAGQNDIEGVDARVEDGRLTGTKIPVMAGDIASFAVVAAQGASGLSAYLVDLDQDGVTRKSIQSFDPSRSMAEIEFRDAQAELLGTDGEGEALISHVLDRAAVLMAFEQLGSAQACFDATKEFTQGRYAFGRPVASFQAMKHRLADMWCELELARSNAYYGAWALSGEEDELPVAACISHIQASEAFSLISVEMIQMHGGVGYTWEYDCHLFYRRAKLLEATLGSAAAWKNKLVDRIDEDDE